MEDFLYILAIIAWVVYSFYKNSQKVKKNRPATRRPVEETPEEKRDFRSILEEILGQEEESIPEYQAEAPAPAREVYKPMEYTPSQQPQQEFQYQQTYKTLDDLYEESGMMPSQMQVSLEDMDNNQRIQAVSSLEEKKETPRWKADIRTAIILSEILNRPYDERSAYRPLWQT
ncbi:MAG TPA: hypothetical protein PLE85_04915 [Bacteroidales bacterium]|nr:hypothetical protein [Lentimicrobiaceae bacterium]HOH99862.1 hypothetical protein [Bacteroidales bacterium]